MQQASQLGYCEVNVLVARRLKPKPEACMLYVGLDVIHVSVSVRGYPAFPFAGRNGDCSN